MNGNEQFVSRDVEPTVEAESLNAARTLVAIQQWIQENAERPLSVVLFVVIPQDRATPGWSVGSGRESVVKAALKVLAGRIGVRLQ